MVDIGDLIRFRRDSFALRLANEDDLAGITAKIESDRKYGGTLEHWYVLYWTHSPAVAPRIASFPEQMVQLVGLVAPGKIRITSPLQAISEDRSVAKTENSIYELREGGPVPMSPEWGELIRRSITNQQTPLAVELGIHLPIGQE